MFELPTEFAKTVSAGTAAVYKSKLNKLDSYGFSTVEQLRRYPEAVIGIIKDLTGEEDDERSRHARRYYLSAIFWVSPGLKEKKNKYHTYWQSCIPLKVVGGPHDGEKWKKKINYHVE